MSEPWKLEKDLCRCCHSEGSFHNLLEPRLILGQTEYYLEMLRQSFSIELEPVPGIINELTFTICDTCIMRLRDASNFKQQVLLCEKRFKEVYKDILKALTPSDQSTNVIKVEVPNFQAKFETPSTFQDSIKVEVDRLDDDDDPDFSLHFDDEDDTALSFIKNEDSKKSTKPKGAKKEGSTAKKKKPKSVSRLRKKKTEGASDEAQPSEGGSEKPKKGKEPWKSLKIKDYKKEGDCYICAHCGDKYEKRGTLILHVKIAHYELPQYVCPYCQKVFNTLAPFTIHKLEEHNVDDRVKCKACDAYFGSKDSLRPHLKNVHMMGGKRKCDSCEFETFSTIAMSRHKVKHKAEKEFHCRFCAKSFLRRQTLNVHEKIHTGEKNKVCRECGQAFVQKASLNYHMAKHHPNIKF